MGATRAAVAEKRDRDLTDEYIVQVRTPDEEPIRSHRRELDDLGFEVLGYSLRAENAATARIKKSEFDRFTQRVARYADRANHPGKTNLAVIEDIGDVPVEEKLDEALPLQEREIKCIISLFDVLSDREKNAVAEDISAALSRRGAQDVSIDRYLSGTVAVIATVDPRTIRELGQEYSTVRSIALNASIVIGQSYPAEDIPNAIEVSPPRTDVSVAVLDSGIEQSSSALRGLVDGVHHFLPPGTSASDGAHGTLVGSRVVFGDNLEEVTGTYRLNPVCKVVDVPIFGLNAAGQIIGPYENELIKILNQIVPRLAPQVRIFNLSLSTDRSVQRHRFTDLAHELDFLSREYDVLFIVAAGNIVRPTGTFPNHFLHDTTRVQSPAESLLALTVGSIAKHTTENTLARVDEVSPFSCRGPGSDNGLKPEVVAHGGNLLRDWTLSPRTSAYGIHASGRKLAYDVGTSFAAPIVSQGAARILSRYPNASVNLVKALLCHFVRPALEPTSVGFDPGTFCGFGEPDIDSCLVSPRSSVTYIYEGQMTSTDYEFIKFHVPDSLAAAGRRSHLRVRATLVYNPQVDRNNQPEYSKARMTMALMKPQDSGSRLEGIPSQFPSHSLSWNPILHFSKNFSMSYLTGEWEARIRLFTRGGLPSTYVQNYALVVEIIDLLNGGDIYREIADEYGNIYSAVPLDRAA